MNLDKISSALTIWDIVKEAFGFLDLFFGFLIIFWRSIKVFFRLGRNLGRKVFVFCPPGGNRNSGTNKNMERELIVLRNSGYFEVPKQPITDFNSIDVVLFTNYRNCQILGIFSTEKPSSTSSVGTLLYVKQSTS